jgi:hypothetical protein
MEYYRLFFTPLPGFKLAFNGPSTPHIPGQSAVMVVEN